MCTTCGCGQGETRIEGPAQGRRRFRFGDGAGAYFARRLHAAAAAHAHAHADSAVHAHDDADPAGHAHGHDDPAAQAADHADPAAHAHDASATRIVRVEQDILAKNNAYAAANRRLMSDLGIFAVNLVSSPGSGKTTLLVRTIEAMSDRLSVVVIEGDQQTSNDAERIRATGAPAIQINTGRGCHLDARMVGQALDRLQPAAGALLMIENVGNLVCPAEFDLGEAHKVVILSVTEGEDKPLKYPNMFRAADLMLLAKTDLLPYLSFDVQRCVEYARQVNPRIEVLAVSSVTGEGLEPWLAWLQRGVTRAGVRAIADAGTQP